MKRVAVVGLGITGRSVAMALREHHIDVVAVDDRVSEELSHWGTDHGFDVLDGSAIDLMATLSGLEAVFPAPGLPDHHRVFDLATAAGVPVMSEFDLAAMWDDRPVIAVTGTDGKTTVVTLIERMLNASGVAAVSVGNTDTPWVEAIADPEPHTFVVEASSFRLAHSQRFSPAVAVWLNFGPDHLDAHRDLDAYEQAKAQIWAHLEPGAVAIANRNDATVRRHAEALHDVPVDTFGLDQPVSADGHGVRGGQLILDGQPLVAVDQLPKALPHDLENALAAAISAHRGGAERHAIVNVLQEFTGLPHRAEFIAEIDGVRYVNDSKATTPHAAAAALSGFESVVLIAGGKAKGLPFDDMVAAGDRVRHVVAIGDASHDIKAAFSPVACVTIASSMEAAVEQAAGAANPGDVVLLSPACASYDWYRSYVHRGEDFTNIVRRRSSESSAP